jgi:putative DNA primase/helicase
MDKGIERGAVFLDEHAEKKRGSLSPVPSFDKVIGEHRQDAPAGNPTDWNPPQPLTAKIEAEPYPLDALPDIIRAAVEEVAGFTHAPVAMVAASALSAVSLACQALADAERAENLHSPVGLYLLTIADSGERKSTCDGFFTRAIRDYEDAQREAAKPILANHRADIEAWEAKRSGIKERLRSLAKGNKPTGDTEAALRDLERDKPKPPKIPRLLYADATPESLAFSLAKQWASGGVVSAEAGIVFGSHGMGSDSVMRNLAQLNQLWDGNTLTIDRRTSESYTVRGARLTIALQIQEPTLREFLTKSGALARGTGFFARFLVALPESTQGTRMFTEAPDKWIALAAFNRRITAMLEQPAPIDEDGALNPPMLSLSPDAKAAWVEYHDAIERELSSGGEFFEIRDVASKSADNAVRLAALFQMFESNEAFEAVTAISMDAFKRAALIAAWYLNESLRFFGELALPPELADAARLDSWLIEYCRRERTRLVGKRTAMQYSPLRNKTRMDAAITELSDLDRLEVRKDGKRVTLAVNPLLLGGAA